MVVIAMCVKRVGTFEIYWFIFKLKGGQPVTGRCSENSDNGDFSDQGSLSLPLKSKAAPAINARLHADNVFSGLAQTKLHLNNDNNNENGNTIITIIQHQGVWDFCWSISELSAGSLDEI